MFENIFIEIYTSIYDELYTYDLNKNNSELIIDDENEEVDD